MVTKVCDACRNTISAEPEFTVLEPSGGSFGEGVELHFDSVSCLAEWTEAKVGQLDSRVVRTRTSGNVVDGSYGFRRDFAAIIGGI